MMVFKLITVITLLLPGSDMQALDPPTYERVNEAEFTSEAQCHASLRRTSDTLLAELVAAKRADEAARSAPSQLWRIEIVCRGDWQHRSM